MGVRRNRHDQLGVRHHLALSHRRARGARRRLEQCAGQHRQLPGVLRRPVRRWHVSLARGGRCRPSHEDADEARPGLLAGADHGTRRPLLVLRRSAPEPDDGRRRGGRTLDRQREQRARLRRSGIESSALDEPSAIHDALGPVQPGRSESGQGRRTAGRNLARPLQRRLLADRGLDAGEQQRRRRLAARRMD